MDRIDPIGPRDPDVARVDPVRPRQISREEREERRRREQERRERERREAERQAAPEGPDDDGVPHIDVRA